MEDSVQDQRKRARRRSGFATSQVILVLLLAFYRIWTGAKQIDPGIHNAAHPHRHHSRRLAESFKIPSSSGDEAHKCRHISLVPPESRCQHARKYCGSGRSVVNYISMHYCTLDQRSWLSIPILLGALLLSFLWLAETAESFFSPVAQLMVELLNMSPTMGGVTLLALGNGAPDVFASMAAIGGGHSRIGLGAIISAGTFVSAFVVGSVALVAAPFDVRPISFARDVLFYMTSVGLLFLIYMKGVVTFWQSVGLMSFYAVFIVVVLVMDQVKPHDSEEMEEQVVNDDYLHAAEEGEEPGAIAPKHEVEEVPELPPEPGVQVGALIRAPLHAILRATIPEVSSSNWNRFYSTANIILCPLLLLFMFRSEVSLTREIVILHPVIRLPLWCLVLVQNILLALAYLVNPKPPAESKSSQIPVAFLAFVMSVFWISFIAGELVGCLTALGVVLGLSPALLGLTVLAWGNSMGDLVADIAIARAGKPEMAIAGCFAGPMFNMLVGLGFALVMHTYYAESGEYYLPYHPSITIAFGFLFTGLLGTLLVVAWCRFRVSRLWGFFLMGLYVVFTLTTACQSLLL